MKTLLAVLTSVLLLSACASPGRGPADVAIYDLGPPAAALPGAPEAHAGVALELRLPFWLDSQAMTYRMAYVDVQRLRTYSQARWAGQPSPLLQQRLRQQLGITPGSAPCTLRVELDDFSQAFDSPTSSHASVRGVALLLGKGRAVMARLPLQIDTPAATADAQGGVAALAQAADSLSTALAEWLGKQPLAACRNPL
ncbi:MAG: cholesterol transport system auxiliary component [Pseudomonadota bacterium]|nr:cholesterol transport system auxiliary component [Pseudomonadota bacterium]